MLRDDGPLRRWLGGPLLRYQVAALTFVSLCPTLLHGLALDDFGQRLFVTSRFGAGLGRLDLYRLVSVQPQVRARMKELGVYVWWLGQRTKIDYWRPVAAVTHVIDYTLWPRWAWLMHLENLAWYAALVVACGVFYRRFLRVAWVAGLATVLYAFDHSHAGPVAWIANRNAPMSALFGVLSLLAHEGSRRAARRVLAFAEPVLLALALLAAESGVAIFGYTIAYALCIDRGTRLRRVLSVVPGALVIVTWRIAYVSLGHGITSSGVTADPFVEPGRFARLAAASVPTHIVSALAALLSDVVIYSAWTLALAGLAATALLAVVGYALSSWLKLDETARFLAAGTVLSALPFGASIPIDRYSFWIELGAIGLIAKLTEAVVDPADEFALGKLPRWLCAVLLVCHGVFSPLHFPFRAAALSFVQFDVERVAATLPRGPATPRQTVVVINMPVDMMGAMLPVLRLARHGAVPAHLYFLYGGTDDLTVSRVDGSTLDVRAESGWMHDIGERGPRATPFRVGEVVELARMRAEVRGLTAEGRAEDVRFSFPSNLEDPALVFMVWGSHGLERRTLPPVGEVMTVPGASLVRFFLPGVTTPRFPLTAIEPD
jgi:hypothetical protein